MAFEQMMWDDLSNVSKRDAKNFRGLPTRD